MKNQKTGFIILIVLIAAFLFDPACTFSQISNSNFSISTNSIYFPGDDVNLNIYSYSYGDKNGKTGKITFEISLHRIKDINAFYSRQSSRYGIDVLSRDSLNLLRYTEEISSLKKTFNSKNDYGYSQINESIPLKVNTKGAYLVKASSGNKVAYCGFIVSDLGVVSKAGNNSMLAYVVDRKSGNPVNDAELSFFLGMKQIGRGNTSNGVFYQQVNEQDKTGNDEDVFPMIIGKHYDDVVVSDAYLFFGYSANKYLTYIFTEQPVYRTNSVVNFKGTIRKNTSSGLEPFSNKELTLLIKDSKNAEVYKEVLRTNGMGSFNGTYKIDEEGALGDYFIYANIDDNNSYNTSFTVEQFKKPEYKVTVSIEKGQYYGKDNLKADIEARYFFGSAVGGADVEYNIYKVRYYRPWWMFSDYAWWYSDYYENQDDNQQFRGAEFIYSGNGTLDSEGRLSIDYNINEEFKDANNYYDWYRPYYMNSDYKYVVQAKVTDKSRREISGTAAAFVTRGGFSMNARTDKYIYKPNENVNIEVNAFDFSDKPVQTDFEAIIYRSTWTKDDYREIRDIVATLKGSTRLDGKGIVTYNVGDSEGAYNIEIKAKDERQNVITTTSYFYVSKGDMWWYYNQSGAIQIIPDKDSYKQGEICHALIVITNPNATVLVTTNTDDILSYKVEKFDGLSRMIDIPITDKYNGGFEINVSYVFNSTFYNSSKNVLVVPEEKFLTVLIEPSRLIYKPRETGELKVRVLDNFGSPVRNAEVSIGIVDESIYSIKEDKTKDIRKFFYGQRSASVSTAYINNNYSNGQSRLITIYEKFNLKSTSDNDLAAVKGRLLRKNGNPIAGAIIVIDKDYQAAVTDIDGNFEFKLPAGEYSISAAYKNTVKDDLVEISLFKGQTKTITLYNEQELNEQETNESSLIPGENDMSVREGRTDEAPVPMNGMMKSAPGKELSADFDDSKKSGEYIEADVRSDFMDAIYWSPYTTTDAEGYANVDIKYPDNLTTWRITSRVITVDTKVGQMTSTVITRKDLLIRMETPRFLQEKDEVTISTIIHNYLKTEKQTKVKFTAENVLLENSSNERTLSIAPNSDVRVDWKIRVTQPFGEAKLYAEALTDEESDAMEVKVPLQPKGLKIIENTIADFSEENKTETKNVTIPSGTDLRSTGMKITVDPSLASTLLTALDELVGYPYGCVEQTMSRFLPTVVVANAFIKLNAPLSDATKKDLPLMVNKGLQRLYGFQHSDGGWGWWENDQSSPFMTAYVVYGLSLARQAGYEIKEGSLRNGIASIKQHLKKSEPDVTTRAYMLYSLAVAEEKDKKYFEKEIDKITSSEINDYARSLIAMTWSLIGEESNARSVLSDLEKNVKTTGAGAAYWEGKQFKYRWQDDKVQTTAMALKALVNIDNKSELKDKVIRWLMMQRQGTAWRSTQETAMVIYALVDYLQTSNELEPDYLVKVFVNGISVFEKQMKRDDVYKKGIPLKISNEVIRTGNNEIRIEKNGRGKVYFSSEMSYYDSKDNIQPNETGFRIEREYFKIEKYEAYSENRITYRKVNFGGNVKSGDEILVKLKVHSKGEDYQYFMLEDPLPSGAEVIKDDWAYTIEGENNYVGYPYYYWRWWYADKEVRDNRVTFFATYLGKGEYEFSYIMRAYIPGDYVVNPAKGMLMYYPEVNGNSGDIKLKISE